MKRFLIVPQILILSVVLSYGQMWDPELQDTLYGNEWIDFDNPDAYLKIPVAENGIFKIPFDKLPVAAQNTAGANFQLFAYGKEIPIYASTNGNLGANDYLQFWGEKNLYQLEKHLFRSDDRILNPYYSNFTDTAAYFLTWKNQPAGLQWNEINNNIISPPSPQPFYTVKKTLSLPEGSVRFGDYIGGHLIEDSQFDLEGFGSTFIQSRTYNIDASEYQNSGGDATLIISYATSYNVMHNFEIYINDNLVKKDSVFGFKVFTDTFTINQNQISGDVNLRLQGTAAGNDRLSLIYADLIYPRTFTFDGESSLILPISSSANERYYELTGMDATGGQVQVWNRADRTFIRAHVENGVVKFLITTQQNPTELIVFNTDTGVREVSNTRQYSFINYNEKQGDFIFISHKKFINSPGNELTNYANYRASNEGGNFDPIIVDIDQLYQQFGYGIERNPICVRNFLHFAEKNWRKELQNLLLVGKPREYLFIRTEADVTAAIDETFYVPTFGYNASDLLLATDNYTYVPIVPLGRLAVREPSELGNYLKRLKIMKPSKGIFKIPSIAKEWTKRVVHLSGGSGASERASIKSLMNIMESYIETGKMFADVTTYYKISDEPIQKSQTEGLKELIETGISIITFFGHSNPNVLDFNFDDPYSYNNYRKYPMLISNGCFSGNCATEVSGIGERFISVEDKGAIGYYASSGFGFTGALFELGSEFYKKQTSEYYGNSIGQILSSCIDELQFKQSISLQSLLQTNNISRDPSIKIHAFPGPDYVVDRESVKLDPPFLNTELDSFEVSFDLVNLGMTLPDTNFLNFY
ncbi:MAG: C25 family cysteine peptidase [Saprospiraceae bacterium]